MVKTRNESRGPHWGLAMVTHKVSGGTGFPKTDSLDTHSINGVIGTTHKVITHIRAIILWLNHISRTYPSFVNATNGMLKQRINS